MSKTLDAIRTCERLVIEVRDLRTAVLRYGSFYGPGTSLAADGAYVAAIRRR
jgi:hypothetical protein